MMTFFLLCFVSKSFRSKANLFMEKPKDKIQWKNKKFKFKSKKHNPACLLVCFTQLFLTNCFLWKPVREYISRQSLASETVQGVGETQEKWPTQCCYEGRHTRWGGQTKWPVGWLEGSTTNNGKSYLIVMQGHWTDGQICFERSQMGDGWREQNGHRSVRSAEESCQKAGSWGWREDRLGQEVHLATWNNYCLSVRTTMEKIGARITP